MSSQQFTPGTNILVQWEENPRKPGTVKSNRVNGHRTKKIVLCVDGVTKPRPGELWICVIERVTNQRSDAHGAVIVRPIAREIDATFPGVWVDPLDARMMVVVLQNPDKNLMLEGDQGIGKSTVARAVAQKLGWEFRKVSGGQIKKYTYMLGRLVPQSHDKQLSFVWADSKLAAALREAIRTPEKQFLLMIDEYSRIDEDARDALLDVIEGVERKLFISTGEELEVPRNVHFMAAGNAGDGFTVRKEDAAAKDRWVIIKAKHMPQPAELKHCMEKYSGCDATTLNNALSIINKVRDARHSTNMRLSRTVSTRAAQNVSMFLQAGLEIEPAMLTAVANQFPGNPNDSTSEAGRVAKLIKDELAKLR